MGRLGAANLQSLIKILSCAPRLSSFAALQLIGCILEMPPNIQPVHRVRAEMLLVAEGELQSQIRSVWASGALAGNRCMLLAMGRTRRVLHISRPSLEPRASPFNKRLRRLPVVDTLIVRVRDACRCVCLCVSSRHGDG